MDITLHYNNIESSDAIKNYVESKIGRIKKYFDEPISLQVTLSVEKLNHGIKVNLNAHGYLVHVEEHDLNLYSAIDRVSDTLERKITKYIEKLKKNKNKNRNGAKSLVVEEQVFSIPETEKKEKQLITVKNYEIKIMNTEEAAMQMDLLNREFLVFINDETDNVTVMYKRKDGNYGVIEARNR